MPYAAARDTHLFYREKGRGRVALFMPPFMMDSRFWLDQLSGLSDIRRVIAIDPRGYGQSEPSTASQLRFGEYAQDLLGFMDSLGLDEPVDLVGISGSGVVAGMAYEAAPQRFSTLTLMSTSFDIDMGPAYARYRAEMARLVVVEGIDVAFRRLNEYVVGPQMSLHARARYKSIIAGQPCEMLVAFLIGMQKQQRPDLYGKVTCPVLIPHGVDDTFLSKDAVETMAARFPDSRVAWIEACGRFPSLENPQALNDALRIFWAT